jgi:hypothetical protein
MTVAPTKRSGVARAVASLATIIVGVILALAANAWWQNRQDRARIHGYLEMLQVDLRATDSLIDRSIAQDQRSGADSQRMVNTLLSARSWTELPESVNPHFGIDDVWFRTGTVDALLSTGDINKVGSAALRSALVRYVDEVDQIRSSLDKAETAAWNNGREFEHAREELLATAGTDALRRRAPGLPPAQLLRSFSLAQVRGYPQIIAAFQLHDIAMANRIEILRNAKAPVEDLLGLLDRELGEGR